MATTSSSPAQALPAESFFRAALFFLVLTAVLTLVSTGKGSIFQQPCSRPWRFSIKVFGGGVEMARNCSKAPRRAW